MAGNETYKVIVSDRAKQMPGTHTLVAADDEFDAGKVIKIVKRLEELEPTEAPKKSVDEFLDDFCKYCEETGKGGKNTGVGSSNSSIYDEKSVVL